VNSGIYAGVSGLRAQMEALDMLANNMANVNTAGFKEQKAFFTLMNRTLEAADAGDLNAAINNHPVMAGGSMNFSAGSLVHTGRDLDLALVGEGLLCVETPQGLRYTRNGHLMVNSKHELATAEGFPVLGLQGKIILGEGRIDVDSQGQVTVDNVPVDRLKIVTFDNLAGMTREGDSLLTPGVGKPTARTAGGATVQQGYLEQSNVNPLVAVVRMVEILRSFEAIQKSIHLEMNEMNGKAIERLGR